MIKNKKIKTAGGLVSELVCRHTSMLQANESDVRWRVINGIVMCVCVCDVGVSLGVFI